MLIRNIHLFYEKPLYKVIEICCSQKSVSFSIYIYIYIHKGGLKSSYNFISAIGDFFDQWDLSTAIPM